MADDFLTTYTPLANDIATQTGVDPSVVLGIIDTETGHGVHVARNNIFGISPGGNVAGYPDVQTAAQAFVNLMQTPRYRGVAAAGDPASQTVALVRSGYNTANPNYAGIVANKALAFGKQLGYQDQGNGSATTQVSTPDYNAPAPSAQQPKQSGQSQTETDKALASLPGGGGDQAQKPAGEQGPQTETDKALASLPPEAKSQVKPPEDLASASGLKPGETPESSAPAWTNQPLSLEGLRDAIQRGAISAEDYLKPAETENPLSYYAKAAGITGIEAASRLAQGGVSALIGATQGPGGVTILPSGGYGATPELQAAATLGANPLLFGERPPVPVGTFDRPVVSGVNALDPAVAAAAQRGEATPLPSGFVAPPSPAAAQAATGGTRAPGAASETWRPVAPGEVFQPGRKFRMNQTTGQSEVLEPQPAGAPGSAGAAGTPYSAAAMTPEEAANARTVANKQWLNNPVQPGIRDTTADIPGITLNEAEQEQTVQAARELKALKTANPALTQEEKLVLDRNSRVRKDYFDDTIGSDVTRAADLKAANQQIEAALGQVWKGKGEADPTPVNAQIQTELNSSAGDLPPVQTAMKQVSDSLEKAGTDPEAMYRTHRLINYLQSKQGQIANPGYGAESVQAALTRVKQTLAGTIDGGAPGFGNAMSDYAAARGPIDAAKALQDRENGLYDSRGHMQFNPVHKLLRDIIEAQRWDAPDNPLQFVSDEQMQRLQTLHDNLKRVATAQDLAAARGSDTAQNAIDILKNAAKTGGALAAHAVANKIAPVAGSLVVNAVREGMARRAGARATRQQMRRGMEMLYPPARNPLASPGPPNPLNPPP